MLAYLKHPLFLVGLGLTVLAVALGPDKTSSSVFISTNIDYVLRNLGVRSLDDGESVAAEARDAGADASAVAMDVTDRASIERAIEETVERFGRLDILVNNAGLGTNHDALDATEAEWDELFAVNVRGLFFACQSAGRGGAMAGILEGVSTWTRKHFAA